MPPSAPDAEPLLSDPDRTAAYIDHLEGEIDLRIALIDRLLDDVATRDRRIVELGRELDAAKREVARLRRLANQRWVRLGQALLYRVRRLRRRVRDPGRRPQPATSGPEAVAATEATASARITPGAWRARARSVLAGPGTADERLAAIG